MCSAKLPWVEDSKSGGVKLSCTNNVVLEIFLGTRTNHEMCIFCKLSILLWWGMVLHSSIETLTRTTAV